MATVTLIEYEDASPEVKAVYDDLRAVRKTDYINNFWKALAHHPDTLKRVWASLKQVMGPGEILFSWYSDEGGYAGLPDIKMTTIKVP